MEDADELFTRAQPGFPVCKISTERELEQREIAALLGIKQPEVSHLMNGHFSRFATEKLPDLLNRRDREATIRIGQHRPGEPYQEIGFGLRA